MFSISPPACGFVRATLGFGLSAFRSKLKRAVNCDASGNFAAPTIVGIVLIEKSRDAGGQVSRWWWCVWLRVRACCPRVSCSAILGQMAASVVTGRLASSTLRCPQAASLNICIVYTKRIAMQVSVRQPTLAGGHQGSWRRRRRKLPSVAQRAMLFRKQ